MRKLPPMPFLMALEFRPDQLISMSGSDSMMRPLSKLRREECPEVGRDHGSVREMALVLIETR
jgi:hypothetical protein